MKLGVTMRMLLGVVILSVAVGALWWLVGFSLGKGMLEQGRETGDMSWVLSAILLILIVGIGIELLIFAPIERRVLRSRGLLVKS